MQPYTFRFRNKNWHIEAEFSLRFENDAEAKRVAKELQNHSHFAFVEVTKGKSLVLHLDRSEKSDAA